MAGEIPLQQFPMQRAPINITYSLQFEEIEARTAMGLSMVEYEALPGSPVWIPVDNPSLSKADVIAWYRLSRLIPAVAQEAAAKKAKRR